MRGLAVVGCILLTCQVYCQPLENDKTPPKRVSYAGSQLWRVSSKSETTFEILKKLGKENHLMGWSLNATSAQVMVTSTSLEQVKNEVLANNFTYEILHENVQELIDDEDRVSSELGDRSGHRLTWKAYHNLSDINGYLNYLVTTYPKLCSLQVIGESVEGRPIKLLKISNGNPNNVAVWIDGGIHAREWISPAAATYIINNFVLNYDYEPSSVRGIDWYIVPVLNPDGYEYSHEVDRLWRKNRASDITGGSCYGVDLNRNFGFQWEGEGSSADPCEPNYKGSAPFSEPESAAVAKFFLKNTKKRWRAFLSIHSYGQHIVYPWGTTNMGLTLDEKELRRVATQASKAIQSAGGGYYDVGPIRTTIYKASGSTTDWARGAVAIKYPFTIELRDTGHFGYLLPSRFIEATAEEALIFARTVAKAAVAV